MPLRSACSGENDSGNAGTRYLIPASSTWHLGANVPGKVRVYMPYAGGLNVYRDRCDEVVREGCAGFELA